MPVLGFGPVNRPEAITKCPETAAAGNSDPDASPKQRQLGEIKGYQDKTAAWEYLNLRALHTENVTVPLYKCNNHEQHFCEPCCDGYTGDVPDALSNPLLALRREFDTRSGDSLDTVRSPRGHVANFDTDVVTKKERPGTCGWSHWDYKVGGWVVRSCENPRVMEEGPLVGQVWCLESGDTRPWIEALDRTGGKACGGACWHDFQCAPSPTVTSPSCPLVAPGGTGNDDGEYRCEPNPNPLAAAAKDLARHPWLAGSTGSCKWQKSNLDTMPGEQCDRQKSAMCIRLGDYFFHPVG